MLFEKRNNLIILEASVLIDAGLRDGEVEVINAFLRDKITNHGDH